MGGTLRRRPYLWLVMTVLLLAFFVSGGPPEGHSRHSLVLTIAALAVQAYSLVAGLVLWPRLVERRGPALPPSTIAYIRWSLGLVPTLVGIAGATLGAAGWVAVLGLAESVAVLTVTAVRLARAPRPAG